MPETTTGKDIRSAIKFRSVAKQSTPGTETPTVRSFSLKDYKWTEKYQINGANDLHTNDAIPKLILVERQPIKKYDWSKIVSSLQAVDQIPGLSQLITTSLSPVNSASQLAGSNYLNSLSDKYSASVAASEKLLDISDLESLIEGPVVATYEIPFFSELYLRSNTRDGWSIGSAIENAGQFTELINDGFQLNILKSPQWQNNNSDGMDWEVEFFLLNSDLDALHNNFQFIHALFPGTQWIRMKADSFGDAFKSTDAAIAEKIPLYKTLAGGDQLEKLGNTVDKFLAFTKSPNVFRVECPGRFLQLFVAIDMEVTYVGNVRRMPLNSKIIDVPAVNDYTLYPDAYKIRLSARDLTPNCYNVYANYLMSQSLVSVDKRGEPSLSTPSY